MSVETNTSARSSSGAGILAPRMLATPTSVAFIASGTIGLTVAILADTVIPGLGVHRGAEWIVSGVLMTLSDLLFLTAVVALFHSRGLRDGRLRSWALALATAGAGGVVAGEIALRVNYNVGQSVFSAVGPLQGLGMVLIGAAVLKGGVIRGWRRWPALLTGIYVFAVLGPALAASGGQNLPALAGLHTLTIATGLAFTRD